MVSTILLIKVPLKEDDFATTVVDSIEMALEYYQKAISSFLSVGDKAHLTTTLKKCEVLLMKNSCNLPNIEDNIDKFKDKYSDKSGNGRSNLAFLAFANCVLVKLYCCDFLKRNYFPEDAKCSESMKKTYYKCTLLLNEAEKASDELKNKFGSYRVRFIRAFLEFTFDIYENCVEELITHNDAVDKFKEVLACINTDIYAREKRIIAFILSHRYIDSNISFRFFKFYPIILQ